jgi:hypothetical protein
MGCGGSQEVWAKRSNAARFPSNRFFDRSELRISAAGGDELGHRVTGTQLDCLGRLRRTSSGRNSR